jgi:predicted esterase
MLYNAAPYPKSVKWYEAGHDLNKEAYVDWLEWLHKTVKTTPIQSEDQEGPKL